jgi:hypothetical protein
MIQYAHDCLYATPLYAHLSMQIQWTSVTTHENERNEINVDLEL